MGRPLGDTGVPIPKVSRGWRNCRVVGNPEVSADARSRSARESVLVCATDSGILEIGGFWDIGNSINCAHCAPSTQAGVVP